MVKVLTLTPTRERLREVIEKNEDDWEISEIVYFKCRDALRDIDLCQITERDVERIIRAFVISWGEMGRVLGRRIYVNWERELCRVIKENCELFNGFRDKKLVTSDLKPHKDNIEKCYSMVRKIIGPTSASKVLHLICSDFFPLWDAAIRNAIAEGRENYYEFMKEIQQFVQKYSTVLNELSVRYRKSVVKLVDEYFFEITR